MVVHVTFLQCSCPPQMGAMELGPSTRAINCSTQKTNCTRIQAAHRQTTHVWCYTKSNAVFSLVQYPLTNQWNEANLTPLPMPLERKNSHRTMPNRSSGFALGRFAKAESQSIDRSL
jgi:hypothetical protein